MPGISTTYAILGGLLLAYLVSLLVRAPADRSTLLDGWLVDLFELVVCALAVGRAFRGRPARGVSLALGAAMFMWAFGDVALTVESLGGATPPNPSVADLFYLLFFPLAYLGLALRLRRESTRLVPATWLDGLVAGLGSAAVCAAFAFHSIEHLTGNGTAGVATNLAYPVGDVLLLAMVVGGSALLPGGSRRGAWLLVAAGCALNAIGDTLSLLQATGGGVGAVVDGIAWPAALFLISLALWARPRPADPTAITSAPGFVLPGLGAVSALCVLLLGSITGVNGVAVALAGSTLAVVGLRLALSLGSLRKLTDERHRQSVTDQLTGLGNRRRLAEVLDSFFAEQANELAIRRTVAFLYVDLDHFKEINDSFGHSAGDQLLEQIGPRIGPCLTESDLLARIGGDELAVILVDANLTRAIEVAERVAAVLRDPFVLEMVDVQIGVSIGIALAPDHAASAAALMHRADQAMYRAKQNELPFEIYDGRLDDETDRLRLVDELRAALGAKEFELYYQPQLDLATGRVSTVEALLRWPHPRLGFVPPLDFLRLAEEAGLMRDLTTLVLDQALEQCARWRAEGRALSVAVNVSATNIQDTGFSSLIRQQLERHELPAAALVLEITETTVISDFDRSARMITELRDLGCLVSIDDFGAGFTSLAYLSRLAVGELKLDRSFLPAVCDDATDYALVRATVDLAHALELEVVAEGVEDQAMLDALVRLGCDRAQGFHIAPPAPAAALTFHARRNRRLLSTPVPPGSSSAEVWRWSSQTESRYGNG